ncbi:unnamed protein product [Knipowitschia caucasica]
MSYYFLEIPLLCVGIPFWVFCCYYVKQQRREGDEEALVMEAQSVYVIPVCEEDPDRMFETRYAHRDGPDYCPRDLGLPPPYRLEPPSYMEAAPPSYADVFRDTAPATT